MATRVILCIDDSPIRFGIMYRMAAQRGVQLIVTEDPEFISMVLLRPVDGVQIVGVCLDHDMPGRDASRIARDSLCEKSFPVAVVSSNRDGADKLSQLLTEFAVPNEKIPAGIGGVDWVERVFEFFGVSE